MKSGFDSMGKEVPVKRLNAGYEALKQMLPDAKPKLRMSIVSKAANAIKRDRPYDIIGATSGLDKDLAKLDLTGRYRLLATLLT